MKREHSEVSREQLRAELTAEIPGGNSPETAGRYQAQQKGKGTSDKPPSGHC